jgi:hypothetical protein
VIGEGAMRNSWESETRRLGLVDRVRFPGWHSQQQCAEALAGAPARVLPTANYLDAETGFLIAPQSCRSHAKANR